MQPEFSNISGCGNNFMSKFTWIWSKGLYLNFPLFVLLLFCSSTLQAHALIGKLTLLLAATNAPKKFWQITHLKGTRYAFRHYDKRVSGNIFSPLLKACVLSSLLCPLKFLLTCIPFIACASHSCCSACPYCNLSCWLWGESPP